LPRSDTEFHGRKNKHGAPIREVDDCEEGTLRQAQGPGFLRSVSLSNWPGMIRNSGLAKRHFYRKDAEYAKEGKEEKQSQGLGI